MGAAELACSHMSRVLAELVELLRLEKIEENLFRGQSQDLGWGSVFGGQVLGQALSAAAQTVPKERVVHSLHAYFLRSGDVSRPILYQVDRSRDGGSFTSRRVQAVQNGSAIFTMAASFQAVEQGLDHQDPMPSAPPPEQWPTEQERFGRYVDAFPKLLQERYRGEHSFEYRSNDVPEDPRAPAKRAGRRMLWFKATGPLPDDGAVHKSLFAYASDHSFIATAMLPHGVSWVTPGMQVASLDHAIWFHGELRVDDWLLYVMDSPAASSGRGLVRGQIFTRDGRLVASTAQEGLIRKRGV